MVRECATQGCSRPTQFMKCNKHTDQTVVGPLKERFPTTVIDWGGRQPRNYTAEEYLDNRLEGLERRRKEARKTSKTAEAMATIVAGTIMTFFYIFESYGKMINSILRIHPLYGLVTVIFLHLIGLYYLSKGL